MALQYTEHVDGVAKRKNIYKLYNTQQKKIYDLGEWKQILSYSTLLSQVNFSIDENGWP
ncbi:MAG: hypothetical protein OEY36_03815 [Gammaproteobacteria bacterium]|nr:hypothetical protein [Gammaproteobacteria bacterium]